MTVHLVEDHPTHFKLSNGAIIHKTPESMCAGGIYDFVSKQAKMLADGGDPETAPNAYQSSMEDNIANTPVALHSELNYVPTVVPQTAPIDLGTPQPQGVSGNWSQAQVASPLQNVAADSPGTISDVNLPAVPDQRQQQQQQPGQTNIPGYLGQLNTTTTEHVQNDPNRQALLDENKRMADQNAATVGQQGQILHDQLSHEADLANKKQAFDQGAADTITTEANARQAVNNDYQTNVKGLMNQYAKQNIVPKSIFQSDNIGQNIAAAMAIGLGALGGALTGSNQNVGLEIINKSIERDIEAQKINLEKIPNQVNMLGVAYKAARDAGLDDEKSRLMAKSKAYDAVADQYEAMGKNSQAAMVQKNAALEANKLRIMSNDAMMKATSTTVKTQASPYFAPQKFTDNDTKISQDIQKKDDAIQHIRALAEIASKRGDLGAISGRLQSLKGALGLQGSTTAELQRSLQTLMTDDSFTSRYSADIADVLKKEGPTMTERPEQFFAKLNGIDQLNVNEDDRLWSSKPAQRDVQRIRLKSPLQPERSSANEGQPSSFVLATGKKKK